MKRTSFVVTAGLVAVFAPRAWAYTCQGGVEASKKDCCRENILAAAKACEAKGFTCNSCTGEYSGKALKDLKGLAQTPDSADGDGGANTPSAAKDCGHKCVEFANPDGSTYRKQGGTLSWRENNPGNLEYGQFARDHGAIGRNGRWAVFPDEATGTQAMQDLVQQKYGNGSIKNMVYHYAPPNENDSAWYANSVANETGVPRNTRINDLSDEQFKRMIGAMRRVEGWKVGRTTYRYS